jgi:CRISPR-associated protein Cmr1
VYRDDKPKIAEKDMYDVAYGAFPLQPGTQYKGNDTKAGTLTRLEGTFTLELTVPPEFEEEVRDAVTAWLLFGGIGGRTRRGFGTLRPDLPVEVKTFLDKFKEEKTLSLVPSLHNAKFKLRPAEFDKPDEAWKKALERLRSFRQGIGTGRKNGTGNDQPGRSLWPEADLIRAMTGSAAPNHQKPVVDVKKAPRVAFGMPIIVHFKDVDKGDPEDTRFLPRDRERMASPVIVKAMPVTRNGQTKWQAGCLLLSVAGRNEIQVELHHDKEKLGSVDWRLSKPEAEQIAALKGRSHDVLDAFLEYFQGN